MNKKIIGSVIVLALVAGGAFYGGTLYAKKNMISMRAAGSFGGNRMIGSTRGEMGGFTIGEIVSKGDTGITVKMQDGSTKIILIATSTQIMKSESGAVGDLTVGTNVLVMGSLNSDGSLSAQSVQIRPEGATFPQVGRMQLPQ